LDTGIIVSAISGIISISLLVFLLTAIKKKSSGNTGDSNIEAHLLMLEKSGERLEQSIKSEIARNREETSATARHSRDELSNSFKTLSDSLLANLNSISGFQRSQLDIFTNQLNTLTATNEQRLESMRHTVEEKLKMLQDDNSQKLELMRATVDEKLSSTLEKRLGDSFKLVSERLELVHKGLGEMQSLATGVGDLKKVLSNVKTRGIWGEIQLGNILEQILTPDQYSVNVITKENSSERVEFAVRLPGKGDDGGEVLLPIDAKFPQDLYQKLVEASEQVNQAAVDEAVKLLEARIKEESRRINDKYVDPPHTTDFAIMFLPTEGLYAEVAKRPGLIAYMQENCRIVIAGPSTMAAILNSLSMGFRSLLIQKRSSEAWMLLGAIKTEFGRFGTILEKTQKKLHDASSTIDEATRKTRVIQRKLRGIEELPFKKASGILGSASPLSGSSDECENSIENPDESLEENDEENTGSEDL